MKLRISHFHWLELMGDSSDSFKKLKKPIKGYPPKPVKPLDSDCCGSGCVTCVFDLYELDLERWRKKCDEIESKVAVFEDGGVINVYEYKQFPIVDVVRVSDAIKIFKFEIPDNRKLQMKCGEHLVARCTDQHGNYIIRPYTPVSKLNEKGSFLIAAKLYESGKMSSCMRNWNIGTLVEWRGPFGSFEYYPNKYKRILLLSGGTGITPVLQILNQVLGNEDDVTYIYVIHSSLDASNIIMLEELRQWNAHWNCDIRFCLTGASKGEMKYGDRVYHKRIDRQVLLEAVDQINSKNIYVLICGTRLFNKDMYKLLQSVYGIGEESISYF